MRKKYFQPFYIFFALEILIVVLMALGILPRWFAWPLTAGMGLYFLAASVENALFLFIASIPLFVALPVNDQFDSMANWRILLALMFVTLWVKQGMSISLKFEQAEPWWKRVRIFENLKHYPLEYAAGFFLVLGALSLFAASDAWVGVKKLLFLINVFLLFSVVRNVAQTKETVSGIIKALFLAGVTAAAVGYAQFISVFFTSLYNFWQWWTHNVIPVFYGRVLGELLAVSNTWFSYYADRPPTLRMFSVFPDSHSFGLFMVIAVPFALTLLLTKKGFVYHLAAGSFLLAAVLSGSRGIWLSASLPVMAGLYFFFKNVEWKPHLKPVMVSFLAFALLFPVSSVMLGLSQENKGNASDASTFSLAFERAKSISDVSETSNLSRLEIWRKSVESVLERPFLGVGIGNYPIVLEQEIAAGKRGASAHNLYLDVASEMGVAAALALIFIFVEMLKTAYRVLNRSPEPVFKAFAASTCLYIFWILMYNLFDVVLLNDKVFLLFTASAAVLLSIKKLSDDEQRTAISIHKSSHLQRSQIS